jgi:gliding motility-associated-like protein
VGDVDDDTNSTVDFISGSSASSGILLHKNSTANLATSFTIASGVLKSTSIINQDLTLGDLDGDGKLDLVDASGNLTTLAVFKNAFAATGLFVNTSFNTPFNLTANTNASVVAIGDLDGDGKPDIVSANRNNAAAGLSLIRNNPILAPNAPSVNLAFSAITKTSATVSWISGNGSTRLVFMKVGNTGTPTPADFTLYTANATFGTGDQIGTSGWYCVYNGPLSTVDVTGLTKNNTYQVMVVESQVLNTYTFYNRTVASNNPKSFNTVSDDATLSAINLSTGTLAPTFAAATASYTTQVGNQLTALTITPIVNQANATVTVNGAAASTAVTLNPGANTIAIVVTAQDGIATNTYTIEVSRIDPPIIYNVTYNATAYNSGYLSNMAAAGGGVVTLQGMNFTPGMTLSTGQTLTYVSSTEATFVLPPGTAGTTINAYLQTAGGDSDPLKISYVAPNSYVVVNTANSGPGSLRGAIDQANLSDDSGFNVTFNISLNNVYEGGDVYPAAQILNPLLYTINKRINIDATTQPGYTGKPLVWLNGGDIQTGQQGQGGNFVLTNGGIVLNASNSVIKGLSITSFDRPKITINGSNNTISGNFIGLKPNAKQQAFAGKTTGIYISNGASGNMIGGSTDADRNYITSAEFAIELFNAGSGNMIKRNYIGTNYEGTVGLVPTNRTDRTQSTPAAAGISIFGTTPGVIIGGVGLGDGNLIGGVGSGISIMSSVPSIQVKIQGNTIGLNATGSAAVANGVGINVNSTGSTPNILIGTDADGTTDIGERNVISGNQTGIRLSNTTGVIVAGNYIGTNPTGNAAVANTTAGIALQNVTNTTIGGSNVIASNLIAGNAKGITIENATGNTIQNNTIGKTGLGNETGILIGDNNSLPGNNIILKNDIGYQTDKGISLLATAGTGHLISQNSLHHNGGFGIDLNNDGLSTNDAQDIDAGGNNSINFPVITSASKLAGITTIVGTIDMDASVANYTVEFFSNTTASSTGYGEGLTYLGNAVVTTDANGHGTFSVTYPTTAAFIAATVTDATNNTSEFAASATNTAVAIITAPTSIAALSTTYGTASASETFNISGIDMATGILVTPPTGFEVSADNTTYTATTTIGTTGTIASTPVYVRLKANAAGTPSGNIALTSTNATLVNVAIPTSTVTPVLPTVTPIASTNITTTAGTFNATINDGGAATTVTFFIGTDSTVVANGGGLVQTGTGNNLNIAAGTGNITSSFTDVVFSGGLSYYCRVQAVNSIGTVNSTIIKIVALPFAPTLAVSGNSGTTISLNWVPIAGAASYLVDVATTSNFATLVPGKSDLSVTTSGITISGLSATTQYYVRAKAILPDGRFGAYSTAAGLLTQTVPAFITTYNFNSSSTASLTDPTPKPGVDNLTSGNFTLNGATARTLPGRFAGQDWGVNTAVDETKYYEVTVTPTAGYRLNLTNLNFDVTHVSSSAPNKHVVRSSMDNYASNLGGTISPANASLTVTGGIFTNASSSSAIQIGSNLNLSGFTNLTTPVTFRIYAYNATNGTTAYFSIDNVRFTGTTPQITTEITSSETSIAAMSTTYGVASASKTFNVSATDATAGVLVTAPSDFEVSTDNSTFSSTVTVGTSGTIAATAVYVRLKNNLALGNAYAGDIVLTTTGAVTKNVAIVASSVTGGIQTISFAALANKNYGDAEFTLTATGGASGNAVTYVSSNLSVATVTGSIVTLMGAGTTTITASQAAGGNYAAATPVAQTLTVGTWAQHISFATLATKSYGDANFTISATGGGSGEAITYASSNPAVATITGNTVTIVGVGTTTITASQGGNTNYAAGSANQDLTVTKASQTITFNALTNKNVGNADFALTATGGASGNTVSYTSSDPLVATVSGSTVTIVGSGTTTITASQLGNANYNAATSVGQTLTVGKASQTIVFTALANKNFGDANFALTATGGASGNSVTYTSSDPLVATVSGSTVTIVGSGSTTITASQLGNANYNAAADATQTLTVGKASQTISFAALATKNFGDANFALTATGGASGNTVTYTSSDPLVATVSGSTVTIVGSGSTTITASQLGNANYNAAADATQTLTVGKASQTISFAALATKNFGDANFALTATGGASGNAVTYASSDPLVATVSGSTVTIVGSGSTTITASQLGNANYNAATSVGQTLTVGKASQTIVFTALANKNFGDANFVLTATGGASGNTVSYTSSDPLVATVSGSTVTIVGSGTTTITASQLGNANYNAATSVGQTLTVGKASQTIVFTALANKNFGDANFALTATGGASGNTVTYTSSDPLVATVSGSTVTVVGSGSTTITASQLGNANYNAATSVGQTLTVGKASQTIVFTALANKNFGDANFALTATGGASGNTVSYTSSDPLVATVSGSTVTIVGSGSTTITASQLGNANYNAAADATQTLTVGKASQTISFAALATKNFGDANFALTATGGASGNAVTYASSDPLVATVSGSTVTIVGSGSTTITASQLGNANYNAATSVGQTLTVGKASQTIVFTALANKNFGDANFALTATGGASGNSVTYTSSDPLVATVSGSTVTIVGSGSTTITASQLGNANYNAAADATQTLTVGKASQTISFAALATKNFGDANFALTATGGASGNSVSYTSSDPLVATVSGSTVTIVGSGTTTITASQLGNANYNAAVDATQTLTVGKASQTIVFTALTNKNFGDANFALTATGGASGNTVTYTSSDPLVATVSGSTVTIVGSGTTTITASQLGNANYNAAADATQTLTVGKANQTIVFAALANKNFGDASFALSATGGTSGNAVTFTSSNTSVATVLNGTVTIIGAGTTTITASQAGNANLTAAADVQQILTVGKASATITLSNLSQSYDGTAKSVTATTSPANLTGVTVTYNGSATLPIAAGTYSVVASLTNTNYTATSATGTLTIGNLSQTITFAALANKTFGDADFALSATGGTSGNAVTFTSSNTNVATISGSTVTIIGSGTTTITASQAGNANLTAAADVQQALTVGKASATITLSNLSQSYDGTAKPVTTTTSPANLTGVTVTYNGSATLPIAAGTYIVVASLTNTNYTATNATGSLVIDKASATITLSNLSQSYDGTAKTVTATTSPANLTGVTVTYNGSATLPIAAGTYNVVAGMVNSNYTATNATGTLTIGNLSQTITFAALANKTFGDADFALTATGGTSGNAVTFTSSNTNVATISGSTVTIIGSGMTTITASQAGNANLTAAADVQQVLIVGKASATITLANLSQSYDGTTKTVTATTSPANLTGVTVTYNGSATLPIAAGTYSVVASLTNTNYTATSATGTLTIGNLSQTITFAALANKTFGDASFALSATGGTSGNAVTFTSSNTNVATISGSTVTIIGAGTTTITASQAGNANLTAAADVQQALTVGKASATITLANLSQSYDGTAKSVTTTTSPANLTGVTVTYNGSATLPIGAGTYSVVASLTNTNYTATSATVTLTIGNLSQTITFAALANKTFGDADFALTATGGTSGNAVTFTSSNTNVATISGSTVTIIGAGTTTITASQAGNANLTAAADVQQVLTVGKASATITLANLSQSYDGTAKTVTATTSPANLTGVTVTYNGSATLPIGAGTYSVVASLTNTNYTATNATGTLTIGNLSQTITFAALNNKTFGDADFALTATGGTSGNAVTFTSSNTNVATISGSTVTIIGAGTTTITASQAGNANLTAAADVQQALTVGKASATITLANLSQSYDGTAKSVTTTTSPTNLTGVTVTYNGSATLPIGAGTYSVVASLTNTNYTATNATGTLTIGNLSQTITFAALANKTFGDADFALTATGGTSGNAVTFTSSNTNVATISGSTVTIIGAGTTTITASQAGNTNFSAAAAIQQTLIVNKAVASITLANLSQLYDGTAKSVTTTTSPANLTGITVTYNGSTALPITGGTYSVIASLANTNYTAVNATGTLTITSIAQTITFTSLASKTYGDANFNLTATGGASGNVVSYASSNTAVATVNGSTVTIVGAGNATITASQLGNVNYSPAANATQLLIVSQKQLAATFTVANKNYDGTTAATIVNRSLTGVIPADIANVTLSGGTASFANVGSGIAKNVTASGMLLTGTASANYILFSISGTTADINPKPITVTADAKYKIYGDADPLLTYTLPTGSLVGADAITGTFNRSTGNGAGTYAITIGTLSAGGNYAITLAGANLVIDKKQLTITADDKSRLFNVPNPTFTASYSGFVGVENTTSLSTQPSLSSTATISSPTGVYSITASGAVATNYNIVYVAGNLTISANTQSITFATLVDKLSTDASFVLGATSSSGLAVTYTSSNTAVATINGSTVTIVGAGTTNITANQTGNANYTAATPVVQTLKVNDNPAPVISIISDLGLSISKGEIAKLTATGALTYLWSNADGIISGQNTAVLTVRPLVTTTYTVTGTNQFGRSTAKTITIEVKSDFQAVGATTASSATNIISPNGDGVNDFFVVKNIDVYPNNSITIFDRAGKTLYKVKSYKNNWDGSINGIQLEEGTYYYIIEFGDGKTNAKKGFITIVKQ